MNFLTQQRILLVCLLAGLLPGCTGSTYSTHFDCPMGDVGGCASISKVNKMLDRHEVNLEDDNGALKEGAVTEYSSSPSLYVYYGPGQLGRRVYPAPGDRSVERRG